MLKKYTCILSMILILSNVLTLHASDWELDIEKDGIRVFTRPIEGSNIREFKGETILNCNFKKVNSIVDNLPGHEYWMADTATNSLIDTFNVKPNGNKELYLFGITTTPFGIAYRCGLYYSKVTVTDKIITRTVELADDSRLSPSARNVLNNFYTTLPLKKNGTVLKKTALNEMVRFTEMSGLWIFEKIGENQTKVTWTVKTNPGGNIPTSIANATAKNNPYKTLKGLMSQIR